GGVWEGAGSKDWTPTTPALRWTPADGLQYLNTPVGFLSNIARGVSASGDVIIGYSQNGGGRGVRWTASGMTVVCQLVGGGTSDALGVSGDGLTVVGFFRQGSYARAGRWTALTGSVDLGSLGQGFGTYNVATAISQDGTTITGYSTASPNVTHAFRWTQLSGMTDLGMPPGTAGTVGLGISGDGGAVVGY